MASKMRACEEKKSVLYILCGQSEKGSSHAGKVAAAEQWLQFISARRAAG